MVKSEHKIQSSSAVISSKPMATSPSSPSSAAACKKKKYKGVRMRSWGSWVSEIRAPNQKTRIWLGSYSTPEAAARAYDAALLCLKGSSANLNFPITSSHYIPDTVMSPKSIQRVAAAAANSFSDTTTTTTNDNSSNNGNNNNNPTTPPISSCSSSSMSSSPSMSSSSPVSDQLDDDNVSLMQPFETYNESMNMNPMLDSWYSFDDLQSPKFYHDQALMFDGGVSFISPQVNMIDDFYESDIRLWSFAE